MTPGRTITIVGGGLAGLTLAIGLREEGVPVVLWEAGFYPRHRVCGEFVSGRGQESLARLGLIRLLEQAGAVRARSVEFCSASVAGRRLPLPQPALCLPRQLMDSLFAAHFRKLGGELREGERWQGEATGEGVVIGTGRRPQPVVRGWRWFGLKVHAKGIRTGADLEMHVFPNGYIGLCRQPGEIVNVCGVFRRRPGSEEVAASWREYLRGPPGSRLRERMDDAEFVSDSFCSVAGIDLRPQRALSVAECRIGDALTMIPPVTGNGMSMAFESAESAIEPLAAWSLGKIPWAEARGLVAHRCDTAFARRLNWSAWLQRLMLVPALQNPLVRLVSRHPWIWSGLFSRTR